mmetsp:Transcript_35377/g.92539  ORF Transcript_35377/g.92539 Transcript_35377/m.92539 type:complete len:250 (+) Transcript_35377:2256-3005(+)
MVARAVGRPPERRRVVPAGRDGRHVVERALPRMTHPAALLPSAVHVRRGVLIHPAAPVLKRPHHHDDDEREDRDPDQPLQVGRIGRGAGGARAEDVALGRDLRPDRAVRPRRATAHRRRVWAERPPGARRFVGVARAHKPDTRTLLGGVVEKVVNSWRRSPFAAGANVALDVTGRSVVRRRVGRVHRDQLWRAPAQPPREAPHFALDRQRAEEACGACFNPPRVVNVDAAHAHHWVNPHHRRLVRALQQ